MKKLIPSFLLLLLTLSTNAQSVISQVIENADISGSFTNFPLDLFFKNNTNDSIEVNWRRELGENCPVEWKIITSDELISYLPNVHESQIAIPMTPSDSHFIIRQPFHPENITGCCDVKMIFSLEGSPNNPIDTGYYQIEINSQDCLTTSIIEKEEIALNIYPNPSSDFINIESRSLFRTIEIFELTGKMYHQSVYPQSNQIDISSFPDGVYVLRIEDESGEILVRRIVKR